MPCRTGLVLLCLLLNIGQSEQGSRSVNFNSEAVSIKDRILPETGSKKEKGLSETKPSELGGWIRPTCLSRTVAPGVPIICP